MDFLLAMSIFTHAGDISRSQRKVQEWMKASWVDARDGNKGGAAAEQGEPQQQRQARGPQQEKKRLQEGRPRLAPEFDGINCFETIVCH